MTYVHKTRYPFEPPAKGELRTFEPGKVHFSGLPETNSVIYIFVEDSRSGARDGGLVARGRIITADAAGNSCQLLVEFDGQPVGMPLLTHELDPYARSGNGTRGGVDHPQLTDIAEVRRRTIRQPLHRIAPASAAWLDQNHFGS